MYLTARPRANVQVALNLYWDTTHCVRGADLLSKTYNESQNTLSFPQINTGEKLRLLSWCSVLLQQSATMLKKFCVFCNNAQLRHHNRSPVTLICFQLIMHVYGKFHPWEGTTYKQTTLSPRAPPSGGHHKV